VLTALRALDDVPVTVKIVGEGSEEQGTGLGRSFRCTPVITADAILVDAGNFAVSAPSLTSNLRGLANIWVTVRALSSPMHSGCSAVPPGCALIAMLATLRDEHGHTVNGLEARQTWRGASTRGSSARTRTSSMAWTCSGLGRGHGVGSADRLVLGIDCPPVVGSSAAISRRPERGSTCASARDECEARTGCSDRASRSVTPWHVKRVRTGGMVSRSSALSGPGYRR
jgi:hypothetical protein